MLLCYTFRRLRAHRGSAAASREAEGARPAERPTHLNRAPTSQPNPHADEHGRAATCADGALSGLSRTRGPLQGAERPRDLQAPTPDRARTTARRNRAEGLKGNRPTVKTTPRGEGSTATRVIVLDGRSSSRAVGGGRSIHSGTHSFAGGIDGHLRHQAYDQLRSELRRFNLRSRENEKVEGFRGKANF